MSDLIYIDPTTGRLSRSGFNVTVDTVPPGTPATGDLWFNSGSGLSPVGLYRYNGTRWLSVELHSKELSFRAGLTVPFVATVAKAARSARPDPDTDIYIEKVVIGFKVNTTFDSSNNWTYQFGTVKSDGTDNPFGSSSPTWAGGRAAGTLYFDTITVATAYTLADSWKLYLDVTKVLSPGTLDLDPPVMTYRWIGA